jgi:hypothetical protein
MTRYPWGSADPISTQCCVVALRGLLTAAVLLLCTAASADEALTRTPAPEGARVYFVGLENGAVVSSPLLVRFGLSNMGVAPAGTEREATGHHHLLIDTELKDPTAPVPSDEHHRHFGGGHTETEVDLSPGEHTLQLVLADHRHVPHDPPIVSERITIVVE